MRILALCFAIAMVVLACPARAASMEITEAFPKTDIGVVGAYQSVSMEGLDNFGEPGQPSLPVKTVSVLIPYGYDIGHVEVSSQPKYLDVVAVVEPVPVPTSGMEPVTRQLNTSIYGLEGFFPQGLYRQIGIGEWNGYRILELNLYPVRYSATEDLLEYTETMKIKIDLVPGEWNYMAGKVPEGLLGSVKNPEAISTYPTYASRGKLSLIQGAQANHVIITTSALNETFWELAAWKSNRPVNPINSTIVLVENITSDPDYWCSGEFGDGCNAGIYNDTQSMIRNFIKDAYANWGTEYVLLGGDISIIPDRGVYGYVPGDPTIDTDIPCDMYYGGINGNWNSDNDSNWGEVGELDYLMEVYIGRAPVTTSQQAGWFVNKTIAYENASIYNQSYLKQALFIGAAADASTEGANIKDIITDAFPYYQTEKHYNRDGTFNKTRILELMNSSMGVVNYVGHSDSNILVQNSGSTIVKADVDTLLNTNYYLFYSQGCHAGSFDGDAVGEHLVRGQGGAVAFVGNSRYGWYEAGSSSGPSDLFDLEFFEAIASGTSNFGKILAQSKASMSGYMGTSVYRWVSVELNLLGDPETPLRINVSEPSSDFASFYGHLLAPPTLSGIVQLNGTAKQGNSQGSTFANYTIYWGSGTSPSAWYSTGLSLSGSGLMQVNSGMLGTFDSNYAPQGTLTMKLVASDSSGNTSEDRIIFSNANYAESSSVSGCRSLYGLNSNYTLSSNVTSSGTCLRLMNSGITLDCNSFTINHSTSEAGIGIEINQSGANVRNCTVIQGGSVGPSYGIYIGSSGSALSNITVASHTAGSNGVYVYAGTHNLTDSYINAAEASTPDVFVAQGHLLAINSSYSDIGIDDASSSITRYWYMNMYVNDTLGQGKPGANVTARDVSTNFLFSKLTSSSGSIDRQTVPQYNTTGIMDFATTDNDTNKFFFTNYTVTMTLSEYNNFSLGVNLTGNLDYYFTTNNTDFGGPEIEISNPTNSSYRTSTVWLNYSATDITGVDECWYSLNGAANTSTSCLDIPLGPLSSGQHNLTLYANDTGDNITQTSVFFTVDLVWPVITAELPSNTTYANSTVFRVHGSEGLSWCGYSIDNAANETMASINSTTWNSSNTSMANGLHTVMMWCNDTAGNFNYTSVAFSSDTIPPVITFTLSPSSVYVGETITSACTANDNFKGAFSGTVTGVSTSTSGTRTATCTATDDVGNTATSTRSYTVSAASSAGSGGGSGSGTLPSDSDKKTISIDLITPDQPKLVLASVGGLDSISISANSEIRDSRISVEALQAPPLDALHQGHVYSYVEIKAYMDQSYLRQAEITFSVNNSWLLANNINDSAVALERYVSGAWERLPTTIVGSDSQRIQFVSVTEGFSYFAITGDLKACEMEKTCNDSVLMTCSNGVWTETECEFGCNPVNLRCMPEPRKLGQCEQGQTRCFGEWFEYCLNGSWDKAGFCEYGCNDSGCMQAALKKDYGIISTIGIATICIVAALAFVIPATGKLHSQGYSLKKKK